MLAVVLVDNFTITDSSNMGIHMYLCRLSSFSLVLMFRIGMTNLSGLGM